MLHFGPFGGGVSPASQLTSGREEPEISEDPQPLLEVATLLQRLNQPEKSPVYVMVLQ